MEVYHNLTEALLNQANGITNLNSRVIMHEPNGNIGIELGRLRLAPCKVSRPELSLFYNALFQCAAVQAAGGLVFTDQLHQAGVTVARHGCELALYLLSVPFVTICELDLAKAGSLQCDLSLFKVFHFKC